MKNVKLITNKVLVIGDIILDKYISGTVSRVSPEAPIPVVKIKNGEYRLGGAANVANNLSSLECEVGIIGIVGDDKDGRIVRELFLKSNINSYDNFNSSYKTIVKNRIIGNNQQIVRLDYNDDQKPTNRLNVMIINEFINIVDSYDVVILSDYNKGVCNGKLCRTVINLCNQRNKIVIVDPKGTNWHKYKNATMITPNLKEISEVLQVEIKNDNTDIYNKCSKFSEQVMTKYLLITRANKGMTLVTDKLVGHIPSKSKDVYDVTGAGDTVIATIGAFINTMNIMDVINTANKAAGIVVSRLGTSTITQDDLNHDPIGAKIMDIDSLMEQVKKWKSNTEEIVFTNGCFDLLHRGHAHLIYKAFEFGKKLIVAINSDESIKKLKGDDRPINNEYDRAYIIASQTHVDAVIIFEESTPEELIKIIKPDVLVKGGDYTVDQVIGNEYVDQVEIIDYISGYSTTETVNKIEGV